MKPVTLAVALLLSIPVMAAPAAKAKDATKAKESSAKVTDEEKASYGIGYMTYKNSFKNAKFIKADEYLKGFKDAVANKEPAYPEADIKASIEAVRVKAQEDAKSAMDVANAKAKADGEAYLAANTKKAGVTTTASGLQYEVVSAGSGAKPKAADKVKVHYHGTLIDGTVFDSSLQRGEPVAFQLDQVIPGWTEGVQLMSVGSKYHFTIPSKLAYGEQGNERFPGNSVLIFDVELLDIVKN
jgi:FKBP-type peptidyl-prolyl cis-trans isomerase